MSAKQVVRNGRVYTTSSASNTANACVGVAIGATTGVIDTKNVDAEGLDFGFAVWGKFIAAAKSGRLDLG